METMKLFEYNGAKVVTLENIEEYILDRDQVDNIKNHMYKWLKKGKGTLLSCKKASQYGQKKNFNYARGLWVFDIETAKRTVTDHADYYQGKFDIRAFKSDIDRGIVRRLNEKVRNKPKALPKRRVVALAKKPTVTEIVAPMECENQSMPFDEVYALIDRMAEVYQQNINELKDDIKHLVDKVDVLSEKLEEKETQAEPQVNAEPSVLILKEDSSYDEWKKIVNHALDCIIKVNPDLAKSDILHNAYDRIRTQYGVVWEQEAKEFKADYGRSPVNTRELCWWMETNKPTYKNLLIGKLNTMYSEAKRSLK